MNILLIGKLSDDSFSCFIKPLEKVSLIKKIYILRDYEYNMNSSKVVNIKNKFVLRNSKLRHIDKLIKGVIVCKRNKIDLIITIHLFPHGYLGFLISKICNIPQIHIVIAGGRELYLFGAYLEKINLWLLGKTKLVIATGTKTKHYLLDQNFNQSQVAIINNVIDMKKYCIKKIGKEYDIISIGRIDKNKNLVTLIKALALLKDKNVIFKVAITGTGKEKDNIERLSKELGVRDKIDFLGWIPREQLITLINKGLVYVLTSRGEGLPLALLEAMSLGLVPVVTDVGDISDVICDEENGFLLNNPNDYVRLSCLLEMLLRNRRMLGEMSNKALEVRKIFSYENATLKWEKILGNIYR